MKRALMMAVCLLLLLGGAAWLRALSQAPTGSDEEQILTQIRQAQQAAEMLSPGALMRVVSGDYRDENGITRPVLGNQARNGLREAQRVEVTIAMNQLHIEVDPGRREATSTGPIELRYLDRSGGMQTLSLHPTVKWRKERVRRYLLIPAEEWLVVRADGLSSLTE
jgi:hypothetical protein